MWYHLNTYFMKCKLLMKNSIFKFISSFQMKMVMTIMMMTMMMVTLMLRQMVNLITRPWGEGERRGVACWFCPLLCDKPKLGFTYCSNYYHYFIIVYGKASDVVESWVQWRSDFQSGSRVLKQGKMNLFLSISMAYNVISCRKVTENTQILKVTKFAI